MTHHYHYEYAVPVGTRNLQTGLLSVNDSFGKWAKICEDDQLVMGVRLWKKRW